MNGDEEVHRVLMRAALEEAEKCVPNPTAFCVGCVIALHRTDQDPVVFATGYSRELPGNTHAEANALTKLNAMSSVDITRLMPSTAISLPQILHQLNVYTTLEPCSVRASGLAPCANALAVSGVRRCFIGVGEPADFVNCEGARILKEAGIEVIWMRGMEEECLRVARKGHQPETEE